MSGKRRFVKGDGTLLDGKEAERALAEYDAKSILRELGLNKGTAESVAKDNSSTKGGTFKGLGQRLKSATGLGTPAGHDSTDDSPGSDVPGASSQIHQHQSGNCKQSHGRRRPSSIDQTEDADLEKKIAGVSPQMMEDAHQIWRFSKDVENGVYRFNLDVDRLWQSISEPFLLIHSKINEVTNKTLSYVEAGEYMVQKGLDTIEKWGDMTKNIQGATKALNNVIKEKAEEVTGSSRNLSDQAQRLTECATSAVENPTLNRVADMSGVSLMLKDMSGTVSHLTTTFNTAVNDMSAELQRNIKTFSDMLIKAGEDSGLFSFIKEAGHEICELLKEILSLILFVKEKIKTFLEVFNGLFDKVFTFLGKIVSVIQDVLGLDMELMKEALKDGTIRAADVKAGNVNFALSSAVKTKSSTVVSGAKVTAGNVSAVGKVVDNSRSGHIEAAAVDVKAGNADVALMREGKVKRNLAYLKGANINAGNARATLVDDREVDSAAVGASAAEINVGNVEAFGLGRKGTHRHTTAQPSFSAGNVAIGVRRSRGTNIKAGPQFSVGNIDLTIGAPSVSKFLNQLRPGHGFANFTIPFLGGGADEVGGKSNGGKGNGMPLETAGESTYGLPRNTVEFGDRLLQHEDTGTGGAHSGSNRNGATGTDPIPVPVPAPESAPGPGGRGKSTSGSNAGATGKGNGRSNTQDSHPIKSTASKIHNIGSEMGKESQVSNALGSGVYKSGDGIGKPERGPKKGKGADEKLKQNPKKETRADAPGPVPGPRGMGQSTLGASAGGFRKEPGSTSSMGNTQESHPSKSTTSNFHNFGTEKGKDLQTCRRGQTGQTGNKNPLLNESPDNPISLELGSRGKPLSASGESKGVSNAPGSGVHKSGDGLGKTSGDDYQTRVASIVRREVYQKSGKKPKRDPEKETKANEKDKKYSKEELRRILLKEGQEELGSSTETGEGHTEGKETKVTKKTHIKPKTKPWGEHGNIHGFSTLGTECGKEVKKLGDGIYGFGDE
ncbi:uncharacterized protein [Haliotis asinina]|uniref:uncharacterized protein n=1 Tax=Haliotis asinina TaxID=109174 RepID=UPI003531C525